MPWCRRCCVLTPADLLGVTSILDCELQGCFFLLQCDDRACPDTGRHGPHTNASKFKLKRAKNVSNSVVFCWILEEPSSSWEWALLQCIPRYFNRGFDCVSMHVLVWGRSSTRRARAVGHSCASIDGTSDQEGYDFPRHSKLAACEPSATLQGPPEC